MDKMYVIDVEGLQVDVRWRSLHFLRRFFSIFLIQFIYEFEHKYYHKSSQFLNYVRVGKGISVESLISINNQPQVLHKSTF